MLRTAGVTSGNAEDVTGPYRGWLLGHFIPGADHPLTTTDVEVQWANLPAGTRRAEWGYNAQAHTLAILVRGSFHLHFPQREVRLEREGDYVLWEPGVPHYWEAEEDTLIFTVRWPSLPGTKARSARARDWRAATASPSSTRRGPSTATIAARSRCCSPISARTTSPFCAGCG